MKQGRAGSKDNNVIHVRSILPDSVALRLAVHTGTTDAIEIAKKFCSAGQAEIGLMILENIFPSNFTFIATHYNALAKKCWVVDAKKIFPYELDGSLLVAVVYDNFDTESEELACFIINTENRIRRVCSLREIMVAREMFANNTAP